MCAALTITGAVFEVVGLALVFIELAVIRSHELGTPPPWAPLVRWVRKILKRPHFVSSTASMSIDSSMGARGKVRPAELAPDATASDRIARLESYVERVDEDLDDLWQEFGRREAKIVAEAARRDEELRREVEQREADRRAKLRPSLIRQTLGALFVLVGLVLGTLGSVL